MIMEEGAPSPAHIGLFAFEKTKVSTEVPKQYVLLCYKELPEYMKDNEFILGFYRAEWSLKQAFFSLFLWHNETLNVWTHLVGFAIFWVLTIVNLVQMPQVAEYLSNLTSMYPFAGLVDTNSSTYREFVSGIPASLVDFNLEYFIPPPYNTPCSSSLVATTTAAARWPFFVFLGGAMFCLLSSTACHLFNCHSCSLNQTLYRIDYAGITIMIITSFFPPIFYGFQCSPFFQLIYLSTITLMGLVTITALFHPKLSTPKYRSIRALLFCSMGLFGIVPGCHALMVNWGAPQAPDVLIFEMCMGMFYLIGTFFYVSRIPERWRPGWFDLAGHSHQLFHVFVILGALAHYAAARMLIVWRNNVACSGNL